MKITEQILIEQIKAQSIIANNAIWAIAFTLITLFICVCIYTVNRLYREKK